MRLTRDTLIKIAKDTAAQRARVSRRILCIYLTGSALDENPLLGGTTDIDLVIIHDSEPLQPREVVRLTDEIHLDIAHYDQAVFHQPRHLRADPWFGPFIYSKPMLLHDTQHWFEFVQASTGAQFFQPDNIIQRASALSQMARQQWLDLTLQAAQQNQPQQVIAYLNILENAANALVCLTGEGKPLTERRFLLHMPTRLKELNQPALFGELLGLLLPNPPQVEAAWPTWQTGWESAYRAASARADAPVSMAPCRRLYYQHGAAALWEENHSAAVWLLLRSWARAASCLEDADPANAAWQSACAALSLDAEHLADRVEALDRYLDHCEETLDAWALANGVSQTAEG